MTTTINAAPVNRRRSTLSDQIDRLDATLDGLAEGLNEAVADAVKAAVGAAVREAVQAMLAEVLTHPDVLASLASVAPPPRQPTPPPVPDRTALRERLRGLWRRLREGVAGLRHNGRSGQRRVASWLGGLGRGVARGCAAL
jgi:hypothetical protein